MLARVVTILGALLLFFAPRASADVVLYETGFEAPSFTAGLPLAGQAGWLAANDVSVSAALVDDTISNGGLQSVRMSGTDMEDYGGFFGGFWYLPLNFDPIGAGLPIITVQVDVRLVPDPDDPTTVEQISANIQVYDPSLEYLAGIYVSPDGLIMGDNYDFETVGTSVGSLGEFFTLGLRLNYQSRRAEYLLNGVVFGSLAMSGPGMGLGEADLSLAARVPFKTIAYFDNYRITASAIPEPSSILLAASGGALFALSALRRRQAA